ncbi:MAG: hypothetical protein JRI25_15530, partial [Deltaproteobacteria bacterium]|nr:hypothetical protein [Deltaproteobacteria bacterium]
MGAFALLGLCLAALLPLGYAQLPLVDLPQHLMTLTILRDPGSFPSFEPALSWTATNVTLFAWDAALAPVLSPTASVRLFLVAYVVLLPISVWALARELADGDVAPAVGAVALVWSAPVVWGFPNYALALPLGLLALAAGLRLLRHGLTRGRVVVLGALLVLLYSTHAQAWLTVMGGLGIAAALALALLRRRREVGAGAAAALPSVVLFLPWAAANFARDEHRDGLVGFGNLFGDLGGSGWVDTYDVLTYFRLSLTDRYHGDLDWWALLILSVTVGLCLIHRLARARSEPGSPERRFVLAAGLALCGWILLLVFLLPLQIRGQFCISSRTVVWLPLIALALVGHTLPPALARLRFAVLCVPAGLMAYTVSSAFAEFQVASEAPLALIDEVGGDKRLVFMTSDYSYPGMERIQPFTHLAAHHAVRNKGESGFSFAEWSGNPVQYVDPLHHPRQRAGEE